MKYKFVFIDGTTETGVGVSPAEAFSKLGYGLGAMKALDYFREFIYVRVKNTRTGTIIIASGYGFDEALSNSQIDRNDDDLQFDIISETEAISYNEVYREARKWFIFIAKGFNMKVKHVNVIPVATKKGIIISFEPLFTSVDSIIPESYRMIGTAPDQITRINEVHTLKDMYEFFVEMGLKTK